MCKLVLSLSLLLFLLNSHAGVIDITYEYDLNNGSIHQCISGSDTSTGTASNCWTNSFSAPIPNTVITEDDTLKIDISFLAGQRLRWSDDGNTFYDDNSEWLQVTASGSERFDIFPARYSFAFKDVSGNALVESLEWFPLGSAGDATLFSGFSGETNFTDSYFEFSGLVVEMDFNSLLTDSSTNFTTLNQLSLSFVSGNFKVFENVESTPVPAPSSLYLILIALFGLVIKNRGALAR
ncbi:hypothetical protein [Aliiglaciecola sp. LCG003]|uniref:hypothetical protein n=1 Tax=Aliiglaciecola sp. LCG003 TaxID=3053655 RepID=UPI002572A96F|nr:hypothetical protein [Aliiglaciecola sp. LCG003]WJG10822.1 hypothetical protein QR722_07230 [Aliiglaciecola sp. LCG003]